MNIKILDSWLREYVKTKATPQQIAEKLSLTSVGIEHIEKYKNDYIYDIEVTTNRPELMSVIGIAREAATVLPQNGITAEFIRPEFQVPKTQVKENLPLKIVNDPKLVKRVVAVIMEVAIKASPEIIKTRLETSDIRSLNNVIDVTNYIMRLTGHPTHVFDYDRLTNHTLLIRESKKGETLTTLDGKTYKLSGGDIVADNGKGELVDLLGIMGTANSVVTPQTKRIVFFIDSVEQHHIRKTSMEHGIRTEAAVLNEKGLNPERITEALAAGIELLKKVANAKIISDIIDIYPEKPKATTIDVSLEKINNLVGIAIPTQTSIAILTTLGFSVSQQQNNLVVTVPAEMSGDDMLIPEDIIEEIARVYGYHNIPNKLPKITETNYVHLEHDELAWEDRIRDAMKYWGFTEVYTYPMVSKELSDNHEQSVTIKNPLTDDLVYMRRTLLPSLSHVVKENQDHETIKIFEIANVYLKKSHDLPDQVLRFSGLVRKPKLSFYEVKGILEQLFTDLGISDVMFKQLTDEYGASVWIGKKDAGKIVITAKDTIEFELNMELLLKHVTMRRKYTPLSKYPAIVEDLAIVASATVQTGDLIDAIAKQSKLITQVSLLDKYGETRTFHTVYQSYEKNLTDKEVGDIRTKILKVLHDKYGASLKK